MLQMWNRYPLYRLLPGFASPGGRANWNGKQWESTAVSGRTRKTRGFVAQRVSQKSHRSCWEWRLLHWVGSNGMCRTSHRVGGTEYSARE